MKKQLLLYALGLTMFGGLSAKMYKPSDRDRMFDTIDRKELAIVMFYREADRQDREASNAVRRLRENFRRASSSESDVAFILMDVDKDDIKQINGFPIMPPVMVLFKDGKLVRDKNQIATLSGQASSAQISRFVRDHFKEEIRDIRRERTERRAASWYVGPYYNWYWGYPYYYPYYYRPYYGYGPRFGFYWGW